jgi:hypothetical protein
VLQVVGRKTWWLLPPAWLSALSPYPKLHLRHRQSQLSLHDLAELHNGTLPQECAADANGLPFSGRLRLNSTIAAKARAEVYRVDLQPGDLLYIPPFWAHEVTATTTTRAEAALASIAGVDDAGQASLSLNLFTEAPGSAAIDDAYAVRLPLQPVRARPHHNLNCAIGIGHLFSHRDADRCEWCRLPACLPACLRVCLCHYRSYE